MCNAMGHPAGCNCGFGEGRRAIPANRNRYSIYESYWQQDLASYVNPNAYCPVCGAHVFYYQSPNGGRVFFDALGPPWPKHPCTDNSNNNFKNRTIELIDRDTFSSEDISINWQQKGWSPFLVTSVTSHGSWLKMRGFLKNRDFDLFATGTHHSQIIAHYESLPFWIKMNGLSGYYSIATFLENETILKASRDAHALEQQPIRRIRRKKK